MPGQQLRANRDGSWRRCVFEFIQRILKRRNLRARFDHGTLRFLVASIVRGDRVEGVTMPGLSVVSGGGLRRLSLPKLPRAAIIRNVDVEGRDARPVRI